MTRRIAAGSDVQRRALLAMAASFPVLAVPVSVADPTEEGSTDLPPELSRALRDYDQATFHNDVAVLTRLVAEDYVLVNSDSTLQGKQSYLADFSVPGFKLDPYTMEQPVRRVWETTALIAGVLHLGWTQDGRHHSRVVRIAHVWAKSDGWQLMYTQLTRMP